MGNTNTSESQNEMLNRALAYASHGIAVFPCQARGKKPITDHGVHDATTDLEIIRRWWTATPNANIGAAMGRASGGLIALDFDRKDEKDGIESLKEWEKERNTKLPETVTSITGSGGEHRLYRVPDSSKYSNAVGCGLVGLDIRTDGGYIILPPSVHPNGRAYAWEASSPSDVADADKAVLKLLEPALKTARGRKSGSYTIPDKILDGERNDSLFRLAASLQSKGVSDDAIRAAVMAENEKKCQNPLSEREVRDIIHSALRYQKGISAAGTDTVANDTDDLARGTITESRIMGKLSEFRAVEKYSQDDIGAARLLSDLLRPVCRYNATAKEWFRFDGKVWSIDLGGLEVRRLTKIVSKALIKYALDYSELDDKYLKWALHWNDSRIRNNIVQDARDLAYFRNEDLNVDDYVLNTKNGILRFDGVNVSFEDHKASLLLSQMANVDYIPGIRCERWERFIDEIMQGDSEKVRYLQKLSGICLTGDTTLESMWYAFGATTRNGKSTFVETLAKLLGTYATSIRAETLAQKQNNDSRTASPDIAKLAGKRLVIASEPPKRMLLDTALLKSMTGRDTLTARFLHESEFSFVPKFKLICNTNYLPLVTDQTVFKSERVKVIKFDRHFEPSEQDRQLKNRLQSNEALSGVLNWCIDGWKAYCAEGLPEPEAVRAATEEYSKGSDKLQNFFDDCLVKDSEGNIAIKDLYDKYNRWCGENGYHCENKGNFMQDMRAKSCFRSSGTIDGKTVRNVISGFTFFDPEACETDFSDVNDSDLMPFT